MLAREGTISQATEANTTLRDVAGCSKALPAPPPLLLGDAWLQSLDSGYPTSRRVTCGVVHPPTDDRSDRTNAELTSVYDLADRVPLISVTTVMWCRGRDSNPSTPDSKPLV